VADSSVGSMKSRSLRDISGTVQGSSTGGMLSGPVRELNGPGRASTGPVSGDGSIGSASSGAVTAPPRAVERPISDAELQQLGEQLRHVEPLE